MAEEFYELRTPGPFPGYWKVTARYELRTGGDTSVSCVRLRYRIGPTLHFTVEEFLRLFKARKAPPPV